MIAEILLVLLAVPAFASGPPENMGHLQVHVEGQGVLFDLQVPAQVTYNLGLPRGQVFKFGRLDPVVALPIFQNSLGASRLQVKEFSCEWGRHEVVLAPGISRIRAQAQCPREISTLSFELPFLQKEPPEFLVAGTSNFQGFESFQMKSGSWQIQLGSSWGFIVWAGGLVLVVAFVLAILVRSFLIFKKK